MPDNQFLKVCHAALGLKKLDGFHYKNLARKLHISKPLLSQYLGGDIALPKGIKAGLIKELQLEKTVERLGL